MRRAAELHGLPVATFVREAALREAEASMIIYRPGAYVASSGGGGFGRRAQTGVRQADQNVACDSDFLTRKMAVLAELSGTPARGVYLIRYKPGHDQLWTVTQPLFSDKGLQPVGECVGGATSYVR